MPREADVAWASLEKSYEARLAECQVPVSPYALGLVLAERKKQEQGEQVDATG